MDDDLNTADAIGILFDLTRYINKNVLTAAPYAAEAEAALAVFEELTGVLGLVYDEAPAAADGDAEIDALIAERTEARKAKNWARADEIRNQLTQMGIILEDTPQGVKWHRQ